MAGIFPAIALAHQVVHIADGDTLTILTSDHQQIKVRLANIDAPEIGHGRNNLGQPFGQRSRQSLADMCFGKDAEVLPQNKDRYGRTVAVVICNGVEANREQVARGLAWVYPKYNKDSSLPQLQELARENRLGLWLDKQPLPPWEWRKQGHNHDKEKQ